MYLTILFSQVGYIDILGPFKIAKLECDIMNFIYFQCGTGICQSEKTGYRDKTITSQCCTIHQTNHAMAQASWRFQPVIKSKNLFLKLTN